jgi:hypothetical protein
MVILHKPDAYPPATRVAIGSMLALSMEIANRWMRSWPMRTRRLIESGEYLAALAQEMVWQQEAYSPEPPASGDEALPNPLWFLRLPPLQTQR